MKPEQKLEVSTQWLLGRVVFIVLGIVGLIFFLIAALSGQDTRSRATQVAHSPAPDAQSIPASDLESPYIRLFTGKKEYRYGEKVPVDVYFHSGSSEVVEVTLALEFDSTVLQFDPQDVVITDVFKSVQASADESSKAIVSFFVTPQVGHAPVTVGQETKIATLTFSVAALESTETTLSLQFEKGATHLTTIVPYSTEHKVENSLKNVEGVSFTIGP